MLKLKKFISLVLVVLIATGSIFMFSGCSGNPNTTPHKENVAMVIGNHKHFPKVNLFINSIFEKIFSACFSYGRIVALISDGEAYLVGDYTINEPDVKVDNTKKKQIAKQSANQIISECSSANAKTPEIDTLKAITKAADTIRSSSGNKTIMVIDSGLSTCNLLNFASQNLIEADPQLVVQQLSELHAIPDLSGTEIIWTGCAQTSGEQQPLTESYKYNLQELWKAILTAGGAKTVVFNSETLPDVENDADLPYCSVVPVVEDKLDIDGAMSGVVKFDQEILFISDSDEFVNEKDVYNALNPVADILKADTNLNVVIVGSTATDGTEAGCKKLSKMRADKVKKTLVERFGVNDNQIKTFGAGQSPTPFRVTDIINNTLIESEAAKNRAVYIINADSPIADEFK